MSKPRVPKSATILPIDDRSVGVRELRDHLSSYLDRVKAGESLTITEHGRPIARIVSQAIPPYLLEMIARGEAAAPTRPLPRPGEVPRVPMTGSSADLIDEIRG